MSFVDGFCTSSGVNDTALLEALGSDSPLAALTPCFEEVVLYVRTKYWLCRIPLPDLGSFVPTAGRYSSDWARRGIVGRDDAT